MIFKVVAIRENCPEDCYDCIGFQCCPEGYILEDSGCTCPMKSVCKCTEKYELRTYNSLRSCYPIGKKIREYSITSNPDLQINCSVTGLNKTVYSPNHAKYNTIPNAT